MPKVFISHSSKDKQFAASIIELLRSSLNLKANDIRCTSVEGHRLAGGAKTDDTLKVEIKESDVFLGLISHSSIESAYVLFELGARWGANKHLLPLLIPGANNDFLKGPLSGINALDCSSSADLHQVIHDIGTLLGITPESPSAYQKQLESILSVVANADLAPPTKSDLDNIRVSPSSDEYANAEHIIKKHCENEWPDDFNMRAYCIDEQTRALNLLKKGKPKDIPENIFLQVREKCAAEWPGDFNMQKYCEDEQLSAYRKLESD